MLETALCISAGWPQHVGRSRVDSETWSGDKSKQGRLRSGSTAVRRLGQERSVRMRRFHVHVAVSATKTATRASDAVRAAGQLRRRTRSLGKQQAG